jgi:peptidoglycan/xylan/chitin deacetylase (PgdA/CDA1 family)
MLIRSLLYHDVVDDGAWASSGFGGGDAAIYKLTRFAFDAHLDRLATLGLAPSLAIAAPASGWMITFDDGGASALDAIAPALERRGWRGHFFMTTGWLGAPGFLTSDALRELAARGHIVGSHSKGHPLAMASLSRDELRREWQDSVETLADVLGARPAVASIPGGAYSPLVAITAGEAGLRVLFTSEPTANPWHVGRVTCFGRYAIQRDMTPEIALQLARGDGFTAVRQRIAWNAKKVIKWSCGRVYREFRRRVLATAAPVNQPEGTALPPSR